jgi:sporulation protein YlmC with PRC-barrel domain
MAQEFTPAHEGTAVVTTDGEQVGTVQSVEGSRAHVKPEQDLTDSIRQRLGWADASGDTYELESDRVQEFDDNQIRLKD